jgi:hypothetical protein
LGTIEVMVAGRVEHIWYWRVAFFLFHLYLFIDGKAHLAWKERVRVGRELSLCVDCLVFLNNAFCSALCFGFLWSKLHKAHFANSCCRTTPVVLFHPLEVSRVKENRLSKGARNRTMKTCALLCFHAHSVLRQLATNFNAAWFVLEAFHFAQTPKYAMKWNESA